MKLSYYRAEKAELKIQPLFQNLPLLERLGTGKSLPAAAECYTTPVSFPGPGQDRPYVVSSLVLSADGKMAFADHRQGPLIASRNELDPAGGSADFWCLNMLRAYADALLIGANTLCNEPETICSCMEAELFHQRQTVLGKRDQPCQVIVSLDGSDIPADHITFHLDPEERVRVCIATSPEGWARLRARGDLPYRPVGPFARREEAEAAQLPRLDGDFGEIPVLITGSGARPDTRLMLYLLRRMGVELVCAESPGYCGVLLEEQCLDEYFINYSMLYAGGPVTPGAGLPKSWQDHPHAELASVGIHRQNFLFTRQIIRYGVTGEQQG